ncbi:MAG: glycosyltransferase family 39 protein [Candidatus Latescibacteria bacterium]|nr:glycosyltransferase family 39 protein [Candidatus Latescibacterota bacterium]
MRSIPRLSASPRERTWFAAIFVLALALRLWDLGARSLWFDEAAEYWVATAPLSQLAHFVSVGSGDPPLFAFLLHFWMKLGTNEAWLRMLSVLTSMAGVAGVMVLGHRLGGFSAAVAAGVLAAVNPPDIRYAQDVGQYALLMGTVSWSLVALHGLWNEAGRRWVIGWAAAAFLATIAYYASVFAVVVPFGCAVVEALVRRDRALLRRLSLALGLYLAVTAPVLWAVLPDQLARVLDTRAVLAEYPQQRPEGIALVWRWLSNLFGFHFASWPYTRVPNWIPVLSTLALLALALRVRPRWTLWFAAAWTAYGVACLLEVFPFGFRWGLILCPFAIVLAAVGFTAEIGHRVLKLVGALAFAALVTSGVVSLPNRTVRDAIDPGRAVQWPETEDMRPVVDYWHDKGSRSQPTYVFYGAGPAFAYYAQRYPDTRAELPPAWNLACWHEENPPDFCKSGNIYYGRWLRSLRTPAEKIQSLSKTIGGRPQEFWVVFSHVHGAESAELIARLKQNGYVMADWVERRAAGAVLMRLE